MNRKSPVSSDCGQLDIDRAVWRALRYCQGESSFLYKFRNLAARNWSPPGPKAAVKSATCVASRRPPHGMEVATPGFPWFDVLAHGAKPGTRKTKPQNTYVL